jgi:subtilisin family serine protease
MSDSNLVLLRRGPIDTSHLDQSDTSTVDTQRLASGLPDGQAFQLRLIQFKGPIRRDWIDRLIGTGVDVVGYVPNYAYVVRGSDAALSRLAALDGHRASDVRPVRWIGRLDPIQKIDPAFTDEVLSQAGEQMADVDIELIAHSPAQTINQILEMSDGAARTRQLSRFVVLSVMLPIKRLLDVAAFEDVLFIGPAPRFRPLDELSDQIVAGNLVPDGTRPSAPGYFGWLSSMGLDFEPDFVVEVTDTGLDRGSTLPDLIHPDFRDPEGNSRIAYNLNYADDGEIDDRLGHGTLVASVIAGLGSPSRADAAGFMYGTGIDPFIRIGASRIMDHLGQLPPRIDFAAIAASAYGRGARIGNNSWGSGGNAYDAMAQEYDFLARDVDQSSPGNQEMTFVFAAGNEGPDGHIDSPGVAKNVITVGASESYRPEGFDSCNLDGGGAIGPEGADSALDILRFSSGGPTADGRTKPDLVAPGTHVYGAASRSDRFFGQGLCPGIPVYQPPNQNLYTWSSGTSLATPHVSGAAALVRKFFTSRNLLGNSKPPSPAMIKAFLANSALYMTGANAAGDLPSQRQGWGLVDLSRAFDTTQRVLVDQTALFTDSGQEFVINGSVVDPSKPVRVTLAWTDAPGSLIGPSLVNDLDLEIRVGETAIYRGNFFAGAFSIEGGEADRLNNVESIYLPAGLFSEGAAGHLTITVRAANIAGDGVPGNSSLLDQDFALVACNIVAVDPEPPQVPPVITAATYVSKRLTIIGHDFTSAAQIEINGKTINRTFTFDPAQNALSIKLKRKKLNLIKGSDNAIVVIEQGQRSVAFTLKL